MLGLHSLLLAACVLLSAWLFRRHCVRHSRVHINPMLGFLAGLAFYVFVPCIVVAYFGSAIADFTVYGDYLTPANATLVLALTLALLSAFAVGTFLPVTLLPRRVPAQRGGGATARRVDDRLPRLFLWTSCAGLLLQAASIREFLFAGYDTSALENEAVWAARGAMSSFYSLVYIAACALLLWHRGRLPRRKQIALIIVFTSSSVLLLSLGARLYVAMALISLLSVHSLKKGGMRSTRLLLFLAGAATLFTAVGVLRSGSFESAGGLVLNFALEPLLTSLSLFTLLSDNAAIWLGKPWLFLADFQAIAPSFLFPGKSSLFERLNDYGYAFEAPVGGYHLYFSLLINFGILGSLIVAVAFGMLVGWLTRQRQQQPVHAPTLSSVFLTGAFMFTLFRDPFFISIVKNMLLMGMFIPALMCAMERLRRPRRTSRPPTGHTPAILVTRPLQSG